jgi:hypothetical protein
MSKAGEKALLEGGDQNNQLLAQAGHEGGDSAPQSAPVSEKPSAISAGDIEGVESTLRIGKWRHPLPPPAFWTATGLLCRSSISRRRS